MKESEFKSFFKPYSQNVDKANSLLFWKLSDELILEIIRRNIPLALTSKHTTILDAGGGTGRWICDLSKVYKSGFILYDLSEDMLKKARGNISKAGIGNRVRIIQGDLTDMSKIKSNSVDHIISIYSPISFIAKKKRAIKEMYRILRRNGKLIVMGHGYFNAINSKINNYLAPASELKSLEKTSMVKWGKQVPKLNTFSKESMEGMLRRAGFEILATYGVPIFVQPGPEDFDSENVKVSRVSAALSRHDFFEQVFEVEMRYNAMPTLANRGMNILTIGRKKKEASS